MIAILKYEIKVDPYQYIRAPAGAIPRCVMAIGGKVCLYMQAMRGSPEVDYRVATFSTGVPIEQSGEYAQGQYVGSYHLPSEHSPIAGGRPVTGHVFVHQRPRT